MKLVGKVLELLGLCAIAIGIVAGSAEAHTDTLSGDAHGTDHGTDNGIESPSEGSVTSTDISGDIGGYEDGGYSPVAANLFDPQDMAEPSTDIVMVDPYTNNGGSE